MQVIHNGNIEDTDEDLTLNKWKLNSVIGVEKAAQPCITLFNNISYAIEMLDKHIKANSRIVFHTDVDVDGVGTTLIIKKALESFGSNRHMLLINKEKVHGIMQKHVDYFNMSKSIDLIIITDSSCNEIGIIKQFNCDVLCIDHHELLQNDLYGTCNDGVHKYVIVNNTIPNLNQDFDSKRLRNYNPMAFDNIEQYTGTNAMSCGLVVYELLRVYCICRGVDNLLENMMLYQWAAITLFTDVIDTLNNRNQYYIEKSMSSNMLEPSLKLMINSIDGYKAAMAGRKNSLWQRTSIDKSYIQYTFAPLINKAIRAGKSAEAIDYVINRPYEISNLYVYEKQQVEAIEKATNVAITDEDGNVTLAKRVFSSKYIELNIDNLGIHPNYSGVIASRFAGDLNKNTIVYTIDSDGRCKGSFRGRCKNVDYRKYFADFSDDIYAQGHLGAFGFKATKEQLDHIMSSIDTIEPTNANRAYFTAGSVEPENYGVYHIADIDTFKKNGYFWKIAVGNSKVISSDEIVIRVKASDISLKKQVGKLYLYEALGIECKAFEPMIGNYFDLYFEFSNELNVYIKKYNG